MLVMFKNGQRFEEQVTLEDARAGVRPTSKTGCFMLRLSLDVWMWKRQGRTAEEMRELMHKAFAKRKGKNS